MSYSRLVISKAFAETKAYWNVHKIWAYASVPAGALVLRVLLRGRSQVSGWQEVLLFAVFGFAVAWVGSYCINLIRVPGILHREQARTITDLKQESSELQGQLAQPKTTPQEERQRNHLRAALRDGGFTIDERHILRYILDQGKLRRSTLLERLSGYDHQVIFSAVGKAKKADLILEEAEETTVERWLCVNPPLKSALEFVLTEQVS